MRKRSGQHGLINKTQRHGGMLEREVTGPCEAGKEKRVEAWVARDAIAEIVAPWQRGRCAVGEVVEACGITADPADRDADRQRQRKARAGAKPDAVPPFVELDRDDAAGKR